MQYELANETLTVGLESLGAEMVSLKENQSGQEYLWNGDKKFWGRHSPVLFPFVGRIKNGIYTHDNRQYKMGQHGFARDMEFECISEEKEEIWFALDATPVTKEKYPFDFRLEIGYRLEQNTVKVMWKVENQEKENTMYFSIGAHPGFMCPLKEGEKQTDYSIWMDAVDDVLFSKADLETGLMFNYKNQLDLNQGRYKLRADFFDEGAYIIEDYQVRKVALLDAKKQPYITMSFNAPVVGIWSPEKQNAPFVCIEPWYGRCDRETFEGTLKEREWGNKLAPGKVFERFYEITVGK